MRKNKLVIFGSIFLLFLLFFAFKNILAQANNGSDAIAVRIVPNPNHYSIYRWYDSQGFKGSPQALVVDGYEAVRDGRTVYVNAANIKDKNIYTNIYLISYNQDPSPKTVDILGQIVKNWKFNSDLVEKINPAPSCAISSSPCSSDADCAKDQFCATSTVAANSCQLKVAKNCLTDDDCPQNFFCNSIKAKVIRDLKRVGKIEELKEALYNYKTVNGSYPRLAAGSYLSGHTISVWPSWSESFLSNLVLTQSFIDPINRLGACPNYDIKTCWNKNTNRFVYDSQPNFLMLPAGSYGFVYKTDANGSNYNLCAVMETREATADLNFQFSPNNPANSNCVTATGIISGGEGGNTAPQITDVYLTGEAGQEFNGAIKALDYQNNPLTWQLNTSGESWTNWSAAPVLKNTNNINQKKIYALKAGDPKVYQAQLTVSDGAGGVISTSTSITIVNSKPFIEAEDGEYFLNPTQAFTYSFYFSDSNLADSRTAYSVKKISGPANFNLLNFTPKIEAAGTNRYKVSYEGEISTSNQFSADTNYFYQVSVKDKYGASTTKDFKITIKIEVPSLLFNCLSSQRLSKAYSCFLGYTKQGNHQITYTNIGVLPRNLRVNIASSSAFLSGTAEEIFNNKISIRANDEYGVYSVKSFVLKINSYCGDGEKQAPNTEGRGGMYNDGYEDCDGYAGLSLNTQNQPVVSTSSTKQYGCATFNSDTPYPILSNSYCVFKSPIDGGGYCGDGYCQLKIKVNGVDVSVENSVNCSADCNPNCVSDCSGKSCGANGCGGSCGSCGVGQRCNANGTCVTNCGDGSCNYGETCETCSSDCVCASFCGDGNCNYEDGENFLNCSGDCKIECNIDVNGNYCEGGINCRLCAEPLKCDNGRCVPPSNSCGNNICNGQENCLTCPSDCACSDPMYPMCFNGTCVCAPQCEGKNCGPNGCGGYCGYCSSDSVGTPQTCSAAGICENAPCVPNCVGKNCGPDGCGGSCYVGPVANQPMGYYSEWVGNLYDQYPSQCGYYNGCIGGVCKLLCNDSKCIWDGGSENCGTCPGDCPCPRGMGCVNEKCKSICGDGLCVKAISGILATDETCDSCAEDCGSCDAGTCGDGDCGSGEYALNCPQDCTICGDAYCTGAETCDSCAGDCGPCVDYFCGDGLCNNNEMLYSCPQDCNPPSCIFDDNCGPGYWCEGAELICVTTSPQVDCVYDAGGLCGPGECLSSAKEGNCELRPQ